MPASNSAMTAKAPRSVAAPCPGNLCKTLDALRGDVELVLSNVHHHPSGSFAAQTDPFGILSTLEPGMQAPADESAAMRGMRGWAGGSNAIARLTPCQFYGCASYHRRGVAICSNNLTVPVDVADQAVLTALQTTLLDTAAPRSNGSHVC